MQIAISSAETVTKEPLINYVKILWVGGELKFCELYSGSAFSGLLTDGEGHKDTHPLPKICHTYPAIMKLVTVIPYLKKIQKIYESCDTPPDFC